MSGPEPHAGAAGAEGPAPGTGTPDFRAVQAASLRMGLPRFPLRESRGLEGKGGVSRLGSLLVVCDYKR